LKFLSCVWHDLSSQSFSTTKKEYQYCAYSKAFVNVVWINIQLNKMHVDELEQNTVTILDIGNNCYM